MPNDEKLKKAAWMQKRAELWIVVLHFLAAIVLGFSLFPMIYFLRLVWVSMAMQTVWLKVLAFSFSIAFGYFLFGTTLIFLCVFVKNIFRFKITPGLYTMHSDQAIHWAGYNSLILIANSAFLDIFRVSPYQNLFYRMMGAKVGNGVNVNTGGLADLSLLEIGDNVVIGGGVALICHGFERGFLRLDSTKIGNNVSIGLGSVIMPGCEIGDGASIGPCTYLPKGSKVPPKAVWGGNPARDLRAERRAALADEG